MHTYSIGAGGILDQLAPLVYIAFIKLQGIKDTKTYGLKIEIDWSDKVSLTWWHKVPRTSGLIRNNTVINLNVAPEICKLGLVSTPTDTWSTCQ